MGDEEEVERRVYPSETAALTAGKALQKAGELDDAADAFGQALEHAIAAHGEESTATADYYMAYGDVLLSIVDKNGDVFGSGAQPEDPRANQENTEPGSEAAAPAEAAAAAAPPAEAVDADDLELAFQMLELARLRYEAMPEGAERCRKLADVFSRLGDLSQTNDQFEPALQEYQKALALRLQELDAGGTDVVLTKRDIAAEHSNIARALQYQDTPRLADALSHQRAALSTIDALMASSAAAAVAEPAAAAGAAQAAGESSVVGELKAVRADIHDKVEELREAVGQGLVAPPPGAAAAALGASGGASAAAAGPAGGTTTIGFGAKPAQQSTGFGAPTLQASASAPKVLAVKKKRKVATVPVAAGSGMAAMAMMPPAAAGGTTTIGFGTGGTTTIGFGGTSQNQLQPKSQQAASSCAGGAAASVVGAKRPAAEALE